MLGNNSAAAVLAVKDLEEAKKFYEGMLGLKREGEEREDGIMYKSGDSMVFVYPSQFAGTNQATALTWAVGEEFETVVKDLKDKGVKFEQYDMPGMTREGDVHKMGDMSAVWFKDPAGNILNVINQM